MRKDRIIALLLTVCMVCSLLPLTSIAADDDKIIIHVDSKAEFEGDGSENAPFTTIAQAQSYLRTTDHETKMVEVLIHEGIYPQEQTLTFTHRDSGSENYPVIYRSAGDGEVKLSNSVKLNHMDFVAVSDQDILNRIPSEARDKVVVLSLEGYGLNMSMFDVATRTTDPREHKMYPFIRLNGKKQEIAKWPNVGLETIETVVKTGEAISGGGPKGTKGTWKYNTMRPERWTLADQAVIRGYLGSEYAMDSCKFGGVNPENNEIFIDNASTYGVKAGHRWYIENLLEEIDSPGEYFVDVPSSKLYYYPPYELEETDTLEVSTHSKTYIQTSSASHIIFDGINVNGSVGGYAYYVLNSDHITIRNATICNVHQAVYAKDSKNTLVEACTIYDINTTAVNFQGGGDIQTLTPGNNRVSNCHFYRWALGMWMHSKVAITLGRGSVNKTIGDIAEYNVIHGQPNGQAMTYGGVENIIRYNEMYALTNDTADMGVIYAGRSLREPGNVICYNYLHDFAPIFNAQYQVQGIYWDDWESGQIAHHNIIVPGSKRRTAGNLFVGADSYYCENIVVNSDIGVRATDRGTQIMESAYDSPNTGVSAALLEKYPAIGGYRSQLEQNNMLLLCKGNVFENNLSVDVNKNTFHQVHVNNGSFRNNQISNDYSVFVDSANHDYRLKSEAVTRFGFPSTFLSEDNFSMDRIGIQSEVMQTTKPETPFRLLYPTNGKMDVVRNTAYIKWEEARYADIYEYVVATDPELRNVVTSGKSLYNVVELPDLDNDTVYYYKVWAVNQGKQLGNRWASEGAPYMFKTTATDVLDKGLLEKEIRNLKDLRVEVSANVGNAPGQYKAEAITELDRILNNAQVIDEKVTATKEELDNIIAEIQAFRQCITGYKYTGHDALNVKDGEWVKSSDTVEISKTDDTVKIESLGNGWAYLNELNPGHMVKHFKMKIKFGEWAGISLKQSDPTVASYNSTIRSYLIVIKNNQIEYQKYNPAATKTGIIKTYPNEYITEDTWADVELGCVDTPDGVSVFLKVNGNTVFNELDTENPNYGDGYFVIHPGSVGGCIELKQADPSTIPTTPPDPVDVKIAAAKAIVEETDAATAGALIDENKAVFDAESPLFTALDKTKLATLLKTKTVGIAFREVTYENREVNSVEYEKFDSALRLCIALEGFNQSKKDEVLDGTTILNDGLVGISAYVEATGTLSSIYPSAIKDAGITVVLNSLFGKDVKEASELRKIFAKEILVQGLKENKLNSSDVVATVITKENLAGAGLDVVTEGEGTLKTEYFDIEDKDNINEDIYQNRSFITAENLKEKIIASATKDYTSDDSGTDDSGTDDSGTDDSGTDDSGSDDSGTDDSGTDDSGTDDSGTDDSGTGNSPGGFSGGGGTSEPEKEEPQPETKTFTDIEGYDWAKEAINALAEKNIINGVADQQFDPAGTLTREQAAKIICLAAGIEPADEGVAFGDVDANAWYTPYIAALNKAGIINGVSETTFGVGNNVTREDFAVMICRALNYSATSDNSFTDKDNISSYALDAVSALYEKGIVGGYEDGSFKPKANISRAEGAKIIYGVLPK